MELIGLTKETNQSTHCPLEKEGKCVLESDKATPVIDHRVRLTYKLNLQQLFLEEGFFFLGLWDGVGLKDMLHTGKLYALKSCKKYEKIINKYLENR